MATRRTYFLILLAAANVAIADDGDQKNKGQGRAPASQGAPAQGPRGAAPAEAPRRVSPNQGPREAAEAPRRILPSQVPRGTAEAPRRILPSQVPRGAAEAPRRVSPNQGPRGAAPTETPRRVIPTQVPRGAAPVETPRRVTPAEAQRRSSPPRGGFESSPSMSRTQRFPSSRRPDVKAEPRGAAKQEVQKFLQTRRREVRTPQVSQDQQAVKKALPKQMERNRQAAANVNTRIKKYRPNYRNTFNDTFFERHHHHPGYYHRGVDWWRPYPWIVINNFLGFGWAYPVYFDVTGYPYQIAPDVGYVPAAGYAPVEAAGDWLSLGVFVVARSEEDAAYSPMFVQLAINKEGDLEGTYYNAARDQIYPVDGLVDRESQQAVWKMSEDPDSPIMTTGLFNLTQDVAPIQIHFSDGSDQSWVLVRLNG